MPRRGWPRPLKNLPGAIKTPRPLPIKIMKKSKRFFCLGGVKAAAAALFWSGDQAAAH